MRTGAPPRERAAMATGAICTAASTHLEAVDGRGQLS